MTDERRTRAVVREIAIRSSVDTVWKALTDADELARWFPLSARVEPRVGGRIVRVWQGGKDVTERIERWQPNVHLRTVGLTGGWSGIVTDYHLMADGGGTVLRVVSSGFGGGAEWDDLYDGFGTGWDFELRGLAHYLEHHVGIARRVVIARAPRRTAAAESWQRLFSPGGWIGQRGLSDPREGSRYAAELASGACMSGVVKLWQPPHQFVATVRELRNALLRIDTRCLGESGTALLWLSTYGLPDDVVRHVESSWQHLLDAAFESAAVGSASGVVQ